MGPESLGGKTCEYPPDRTVRRQWRKAHVALAQQVASASPLPATTLWFIRMKSQTPLPRGIELF